MVRNYWATGTNLRRFIAVLLQMPELSLAKLASVINQAAMMRGRDTQVLDHCEYGIRHCRSISSVFFLTASNTHLNNNVITAFMFR